MHLWPRFCVYLLLWLWLRTERLTVILKYCKFFIISRIFSYLSRDAGSVLKLKMIRLSWPRRVWIDWSTQSAITIICSSRSASSSAAGSSVSRLASENKFQNWIEYGTNYKNLRKIQRMTYIEVDLQYLQDNSNLCRLTEVLSLNLNKILTYCSTIMKWYVKHDDLPERYSSIIPESRECGWSGIASHLAGQFSEITIVKCLQWNEIVGTLLYSTPNQQ